MLAPDYDADLLQRALPLMCRANPSLLTSSTWYVVEDPLDATTLIGCGGWTPHSPLQDDVPHLRHFATHPNYARRGVGRAIWDRSWMDWMNYHAHNMETEGERRPNETWARTRPDMEVLSTYSAVPFYKSLGFVSVQDMFVPLSDECQFPCVLMRRPNDSTTESPSS
jgi:GNAT superfamily N-acetyltransferase